MFWKIKQISKRKRDHHKDIALRRLRYLQKEAAKGAANSYIFAEISQIEWVLDVIREIEESEAQQEQEQGKD